MDWSTIGLVVATSLATAAASLLGFWFQHRTQLKRERLAEAREFARTNLMQLQEVLIDLSRSHIQPNALDMATYAPTGRHNRDVEVGEEWRRAVIVAAGQLEALRSRLDDTLLSEKLRDVKRAIRFVVDGAEDPVEYGEGISRLNRRALDALDLTGQRLRELTKA
jgi:hypothetical protein